MKIFILCLALFFGSDDLKKLRNDYKNVSKSESVTEQMMEICHLSKHLSESIKQAYFAAAEMASAQYKFSPLTKLNTFNSGKKKLETAVQSDPENVEIRYIRYTIQSNSPGFLGYTKNIKTDREFILKNLPALKTKDIDLFSHICAYFLTREKLTEADKKLINA